MSAKFLKGKKSVTICNQSCHISGDSPRRFMPQERDLACSCLLAFFSKKTPEETNFDKLESSKFVSICLYNENDNIFFYFSSV